MGEGLNIVIGADISAVTSELNTASNRINQFGDAASHAFDELAASTAALDRIEAAINQAAAAATGAGSRFDTLGGRLPLQDFNTFRSSVNRLRTDISSGLLPQITRIPASLAPIAPAANNAANALNRIRPGANQAGAALTNVGRVAQDLPFGFIGIQNNLNPLLESFQRLRAETGSNSAALRALGSSLIGAGGIGLALSVVSSAFLIFQNGIGGFGKKAKEAKEAADDLAKSIRSISSIQGEATAGVEGQLSQVNALAAAVADSNRPYAERKRALEELKDINKAYFNDLKIEDAATGALTKTVEEYTKALVNSAIQKLFVDEIAKVAKAVSESDEVIRKSKDKLGRAQSEADKKQLDAAKRQLEANKRGAIAQAASTDPEVVRALKAQADAQNELSVAGEKSTKLLEQKAILNDNLNKAVAEGLKLKDLDAPGKQKAENDGLNKQLSLLEKIRDAAKERQGKLFDLKDIDEATDKLAALEQQVGNLKLQIAVRDAKKAGLPASEIDALKDAIKKDTEKRLNEAFEKEALLLEFSSKLKFSQVNRLDINEIASKVFTSKEKITLALGENGIDVKLKKESVDVTDLQDKISKATGLDKKIPIKTQFEIDVQFFGLDEAKRRALQRQLLGQLNETLTNVANSVTVDAFATIGEKIGEALAGGNIANVFTSLFALLADGLQQFGKALIAYGVSMLAFKIAIKSLNPVIAIAAGVAAIAAGAAVKASLPKFADGGIVTGPLIGQIGEQHRPEVVLPLDRLPQLFKQFGGDFGGGMQLIPIINNEGLFLAMKRGERSAGRKF